ncbi:tail fiber domain-containing protein [Flavobacterium sp. 9AF]|uniref:tail fiber domain-containing protein n=1 Tax=Flavobacterium sp. 9AF TaxID=2653142 RepID=UPI00135B82AD|nr:tail fiber domain-containing protein [Flavobacterium sp. 9AF]
MLNKPFLFFIFLFWIQFIFSQVGINTTTPNAQLEIKSSNQALPTNKDGLLIPKIDAFPAINPTIAQQGMMVYLTTTIGLNAPGFYYWDNATSSWIAIKGASDADWFTVGGTSSPTTINDNMYHLGNVAIGKNTANYPLEVTGTDALTNLNLSLSASTNASERVGLSNTITGPSNNDFTFLKNNIFGTGTGFKYGLYNIFNTTANGGQYGLFNDFQNANAWKIGTANSFIGAGIGLDNNFTGTDNGDRYGSYTRFSADYNSGTGNWYGHNVTFDYVTTTICSGDKYGYSVSIPPSVGGGTQYGVQSYVGNLTTGYSGYFSGRVSIGDTSLDTDHYILPLTRGTNGQVMQTDGNGNVTWQSPSTDADWFEEGSTSSPTDINNNIYRLGYVAIGKNIANYPLDVSGTNEINAINATLSVSNTLGARKLFNNTISGNTGDVLYNRYSTNSNSGNGTHYGDYMYLSGSGTGEKYGNYLTIANGSGNKYGYYTEVVSSGSAYSYGSRTYMRGNSSNTMYGHYTFFDTSYSGSGSKVGYGVYIPSSSGGTHYGLDISVPSLSGYAASFLGRVTIGLGLGDRYILPLSRGTAGQIIQTDGVGNTSWVDAGTGLGTSFWKTTGNAGTNATINFIGTTDAQDLIFKRNNVVSGKIGITNTTLGVESLFSATSANRNTAIGSNALHENISASFSTALGANAFYSGNYSNSVAIGDATVVSANNQIRMGDAGVTSIGGFANWTNVSDKRFKKNIQENVPGLAFVTQLKPVTYSLDLDAIHGYLKTPDTIRKVEIELEKKKEIQTGFIAQEVEAVANELGFVFSGIDKPKNDTDYYGLRYAEFVVPLVKAVQEQQIMIQEQQNKIKSLEERLSKIESLLKDKE